ncbi:MAG UNVERIFIED_CONTAM: hypothetical protein LVR18_22725 [Planctomycetaceae bacterium]
MSIRCVGCVVEIQLCSGSSSGVASGADCGGEAGVFCQGCGESFKSLEFLFQQLQLFGVLLVEQRCVLPADQAGGQLDGGKNDGGRCECEPECQ